MITSALKNARNTNQRSAATPTRPATVPIQCWLTDPNPRTLDESLIESGSVEITFGAEEKVTSLGLSRFSWSYCLSPSRSLRASSPAPDTVRVSKDGSRAPSLATLHGTRS
jgi:hypothetical protein